MLQENDPFPLAPHTVYYEAAAPEGLNATLIRWQQINRSESLPEARGEPGARPLAPPLIGLKGCSALTYRIDSDIHAHARTHARMHIHVSLKQQIPLVLGI